MLLETMIAGFPQSSFPHSMFYYGQRNVDIFIYQQQELGLYWGGATQCSPSNWTIAVQEAEAREIPTSYFS